MLDGFYFTQKKPEDGFINVYQLTAVWRGTYNLDYYLIGVSGGGSFANVNGVIDHLNKVIIFAPQRIKIHVLSLPPEDSSSIPSGELEQIIGVLKEERPDLTFSRELEHVAESFRGRPPGLTLNELLAATPQRKAIPCASYSIE